MQTSEPLSPSWERDIIEKTLMAAYTEQRRRRRWSIFFKIIFFGIILIGLFLAWPQSKQSVVGVSHTALIDLKGGIFEGEEANADSIASALRLAYEEEQAKAIILRINSPGGSPVQSAYIYDEIMRLKAIYPDKRLYAVITDIGASAAYYVASAADEVYANGSSLVGSIGVLLPVFGFVDVMQKVGIEQRTVYSGENKLFLDPFSPMSEKQHNFALALTKNVHEQFIQAVKKGRGDRLKNDPVIFSGLAWTGEQALELGLIDGLGSAGYVAREVIKEENILDYTLPQNLFEKVLSRFTSSMAHQLRSQVMTQEMQ